MHCQIVEIVVLCLQLSSLASENKILVVKLKQTNKHPSQEVTVTFATDHEVGTSDFIIFDFYCYMWLMCKNLLSKLT